MNNARAMAMIVESLQRLVLALFVGSLTLAISLGPSQGALAEELRIGFLAPTTGPFAQIATDMINGFRIYLKDHDGKLGGRRSSSSSKTPRASRRPPCLKRRN